MSASSGLLWITIIYDTIGFLLFSPPDGASSGTEGNLPVSNPTLGIQIVDRASRSLLCCYVVFVSLPFRYFALSIPFFYLCFAFSF